LANHLLYIHTTRNSEERATQTKTGAIALSSHTHNEKGFTLIEVLIALMIFAIGMISIAGLQVTSISYNSAANQRTTITMLTQGIMEEIMALPRENSNSDVLDLETSGTTTWSQAPFDGTGNLYTLTGGGTYSAEIEVATTSVNDITQITVTVTGNNENSLSLTSYKRMD
jgi:type IV pilus assembly protein PilV